MTDRRVSVRVDPPDYMCPELNVEATGLPSLAVLKMCCGCEDCDEPLSYVAEIRVPITAAEAGRLKGMDDN